MTIPEPVAEIERKSSLGEFAGHTKRPGRLLELDVLRGFLLLWMTLTHLPTKASIVANQTFGFVSGAEGFIFLAAFMVGRLEHRIEQKYGRSGTLRDIRKRTLKIYTYHCLLLAVAFTLVAAVGVSFHRLALENLLSYYLQSPKQAIVAALVLEYRPSLLDILPMYIVFLILTPVAREIARRWSWKPVIAVSIGVWVAAQFGLRAWLYRRGDLFGLSVPETSTGAFDLYAWQLLWMSGLALGSTFADRVHGLPEATKPALQIPRWMIFLSSAAAVLFLVLRYSPVDHWIRPEFYGWLIDKWHLGVARIVNFTAIAILLTRFGSWIGNLVLFRPLASLGQASIEVFSVHVLFCVAANALSGDADPMLPPWQQAFVLIATVSALFYHRECRECSNGSEETSQGEAGSGLGTENAYIAQVPIIFRIVEPISDDELIGDLEPHILHVHWLDAPVRLIEQRCNFE